MKELLLFISALCTSFSIFAQDYYPIKKNDVYYFSDANLNDVYPILIDSVKAFGQDSVYYMYKQVRWTGKIGSSCDYTNLGDSWLGDSIVVKQDGTCIFLNVYGEPFIFKTKAKLYEKWIAFSTPKWKAEITYYANKKKQILEILDSTKTFSINILKTDGSDTSHPYDGLKIELSKTQGISTIPYLFHWNDKNFGYMTSESTLKDLNIIGKESSNLGFQNLNASNIFGYEIGDIFQTEEREYIYSDLLIKTIIDSIVSKYSTDSSLRYKSLRKMLSNLDGTINYTTDTVYLEYLYDYFPLMPLVMSLDKDMTSFIYSSTNLLTFNRWGLRTGSKVYITDGKNCFNTSSSNNDNVCFLFYYKGLGGPYFDCINPYGKGGKSKSLSYYKKGNEEWGTPLILGTLEEEAFQSEITISPNPASSFINFDLGKISSTVRINLMDNSSKIVYSETALGFTKIDISAFKKGMYFYSISSNNNKRLTGKLIVE